MTKQDGLEHNLIEFCFLVYRNIYYLFIEIKLKKIWLYIRFQTKCLINTWIDYKFYFCSSTYWQVNELAYLAPFHDLDK